MLTESFQLENKVLANRLVFQPMEGFDCPDGTPGELARRKYLRFAKSGAAIIWMEATAVCPEGRTNPKQMLLCPQNADDYKRLLDAMREEALKAGGPVPLIFLQLTHSGRQSIKPITMYKNAVYEARGKGGDIASDEYLDTLPGLYEKAARLGQEVGFDGLDVKACHGYLLSEALSGFSREGKYGGSFENRSRLFLSCIEAVESVRKEGVLLGSRLGLTDMIPYPCGFATDETGAPDLTETKRLLPEMRKRGVKILNVTMGNPYYNPHINRPFRKGAYLPPEPPEAGLERFRTLTKEMKEANPGLTVIGSGFSFYRDKIFEEAEKQLSEGVLDLVGFGRETLAYPECFRDYLAEKNEKRKFCVTCSRCTELMRGGCEAGCAVFDEPYQKIYEEKIAPCRK